MRTHVEFISDAFPPYPGEDEETNPGIWGKRLAEFLVAELPKHGITPKEFYTEDWGWEIPIENKAFAMYLGCSNQLESGGNHFLCMISPFKPVIRKFFFKTINTTADVGRLADALDKILAGNSEVREIRWWDENEKG